MSSRRVLVTNDGDRFDRLALSVVRALAEGGYRPVMTQPGRWTLAGVSRYAAGTVDVPPGTGEDYVAAIKELLERDDYLTVLATMDDVLLALGEPVRHLLDKGELMRRAERVGIPAPPTRTFGSMEEVRASAHDLDYPVVVKPMRRGGSAFRALAADDLARGGRPGPVVVQPYLPDPMRAVGGVVRGGRLRAAIHQRYLRTWPDDCGGAGAVVSTDPDLDLEERLLELLSGYEGVFQAQLAGSFLLDLNPRPYGTTPLAVAAGANFPAIWCDLLGGEDPPLIRARPGVFYRWLEGDLWRLTAAVAARRGVGEAARYVFAQRNRTGTWRRDPRPAAVSVGVIGMTAASRAKRALLGRPAADPPPSGPPVRLLRGRAALETLAEDLDDLLGHVDAPVTARGPWLRAWARTHPAVEPLTVAVEQDGGLAGAALLAAWHRRGFTEIVVLGHRASDEVRLAARSEAAAEALAAGIVRALGTIRGPWRLRIEQIPQDDPVARRVALALPGSARSPGDGAPMTRLGDTRTLEAHLSRNARGEYRRRWNRLRRAGIDAEVARTRDAGEVGRLLPEMAEVRRARDLQLGRPSDVDDPVEGAFWRGVLVDLAERGEVELTTLRFDGALAAYVVGLLDGPAYRMWDTRFDPRFADYSPGRLAVYESLAGALADERFTGYDWMRGVEPYKLQAATVVVDTENLLAWSSPASRALLEAPGRARRALKQVKDRSPALSQAWVRARRAVARRGR